MKLGLTIDGISQDGRRRIAEAVERRVVTRVAQRVREHNSAVLARADLPAEAAPPTGRNER
jgi:hypothetical protein